MVWMINMNKRRGLWHIAVIVALKFKMVQSFAKIVDMHYNPLLILCHRYK